MRKSTAIFKAMLLRKAFRRFIQNTEADARRCLEHGLEQARTSGLQAFEGLAESFREKDEVPSQRVQEKDPARPSRRGSQQDQAG